MSEFTLKLAEIAIGVTSLFPQTKDFCKDYLTDDEPDFNVVITTKDIFDERKRNERQMALEGFSQADFTNEYIETLALYRKITAELLYRNVILFHGAVIACDGMAYAFTAKSGTGKTTHTNLWLKHIPGCHILNGDKPLLLFKAGKIFACGTPWMGKEEYGTNEILPMNGICILERSLENHIEQITLSDAFPTLLTQAHRPDGKDAVQRIIMLIKNMENIRLYRLGCNMDPSAATTAYNCMVRGEL